MAWDLQTLLGQLHTQNRHATTHISTHSTTSAHPVHTIPSLYITIIELLGRSACVHTFFLSTAVMRTLRHVHQRAQAEPLDRECAVCCCLSHKPHCPSPSWWGMSQHKVQCGVPHNSAGCKGLHLLECLSLKYEALLFHRDPHLHGQFQLDVCNGLI